MNKREAFGAGYSAGWNAASWIDLPELGTRLAIELDWVGIGEIASPADQIDAFEIMASEAEQNGRSIGAEFALMANEINAAGERAESLWEQYEAGAQAGIRASRRKRFPLAELRKAARAAR